MQIVQRNEIDRIWAMGLEHVGFSGTWRMIKRSAEDVNVSSIVLCVTPNFMEKLSIRMLKIRLSLCRREGKRVWRHVNKKEYGYSFTTFLILRYRMYDETKYCIMSTVD